MVICKIFLAQHECRGNHLSASYPSVGSPAVATTALALIGLFNIFGTYSSGYLGQRFPRRYLLSGIYLSRAFAITAFLWIPPSPLSTYVFAAIMGFLFCYSTNQWHRCTNFWCEISNHALMSCLFLPSIRKFLWSISRWLFIRPYRALIWSFGKLLSL